MTDYPAITNLTILQGSTFNPVLTGLDSNGNAIDWTGYKARMQARASADSGTVLFSLYSDPSIPSTVNGNQVDTADANITINGTGVHLYLSAAETDLLTFTQAAYDLEMYIDSQTPIYVNRAFQGSIILNAEITR